MADEKLPSNPGSSLPKKETVRITLPPRVSEVPAVKRETVRIAQNTPSDKGQTIRIQPVTSSEPQPKKETTKIVSLGAIPPPPKPAGMPSIPPPKPPGAATVPPPRPVLNKPGQAPAAPAAPVAPGAPKANIPVAAPAAARTPMPKATVKLQQTQPLPQIPTAAAVKVSTAQITTTGTGRIPVTAEDPMVLVASIVVCLASAAAAVVSYLTLSACA